VSGGTVTPYSRRAPARDSAYPAIFTTRAGRRAQSRQMTTCQPSHVLRSGDTRPSPSAFAMWARTSCASRWGTGFDPSVTAVTALRSTGCAHPAPVRMRLRGEALKELSNGPGSPSRRLGPWFRVPRGRDAGQESNDPGRRVTAGSRRETEHEQRRGSGTPTGHCAPRLSSSRAGSPVPRTSRCAPPS
jgi:hypothetical protein